MANAREPGDEFAPGVVRDRGSACGRGDDDPGPLPVAGTRRVTVYHAEGCRLCERALEVVRGVRQELGFDLDVVDIGGDAELEARHRERLPVVEIDGECAFTYFVDAGALRARLAA